MHAYLFIGEVNSIEQLIQKKQQALKAQLLQFPIQGIEDIRRLVKFTHLAVNRPTIIVVPAVDSLSVEALNAFLKALEEPQPNLYFFLTADSIYNVLPTIVSRCQVVKTGIGQVGDDKSLQAARQFLTLATTQRLAFLEAYKNRPEALNFLQNLLITCHERIHQSQSNRQPLALAAENCQQTISRLKSNGNVNLQLTNFALNLDKTTFI